MRWLLPRLEIKMIEGLQYLLRHIRLGLRESSRRIRFRLALALEKLSHQSDALVLRGSSHTRWLHERTIRARAQQAHANLNIVFPRQFGNKLLHN